MKKIIVTFAVLSGISMYAAGKFASTREAFADILNVYSALLQAPNIYSPQVSFNELVKLGDNLNTYVMKKQGIVLGSTSKRTGVGRKPMGEYGNIFDLWELQAFELFTKLINTIKIVRSTGSASNEAGKLLVIWQTNNAFDNVIEQAKKIRDDAFLDDKKKLAGIIIHFMEQNKELIDKAVNDFKYLK